MARGDMEGGSKGTSLIRWKNSFGIRGFVWENPPGLKWTASLTLFFGRLQFSKDPLCLTDVVLPYHQPC
jgi:hypothetical protein